jgi:hypothetical protein
VTTAVSEIMDESHAINLDHYNHQKKRNLENTRVGSSHRSLFIPTQPLYVYFTTNKLFQINRAAKKCSRQVTYQSSRNYMS